MLYRTLSDLEIAAAFTVLLFAYLVADMLAALPGWFAGGYLGALVVASIGLLVRNGLRSEHPPHNEDGQPYEGQNREGCLFGMLAAVGPEVGVKTKHGRPREANRSARAEFP